MENNGKMELRHNNIRIEDLSKKTLVKMLKDMFVYSKQLESDIQKIRQQFAINGTPDKAIEKIT